MILIVVVGAWLVVSVPAAVLLGRLFSCGQRNDPQRTATHAPRLWSTGKSRTR